MEYELENIETDRLLLREWRLSDLDDMYEYAQNENIGPNAGWKPHKNIGDSKFIIESFIENQDVYAIVLKSENKVIGSIGIHYMIPYERLKLLNQREIGYVLSEKYWGNGYVPEAVEALKKYSFEVMELDLLWCGHFDFNKRSQKVSEKCGFTYQFTKEKTLKFLDNKVVNVLYYTFSKDDYFK